MKRVVHITREMSTIEYDPTVPCLIDTIRESLDSGEFRAHLNKGLELLIKAKKVHGEFGWIANTKFISDFRKGDSEWVAEDWTLRLAKAGIKYYAMVLSAKEIERINDGLFNEATETTINGITYRNFRDVESAGAWLRNSLKRAMITML